LAAAAKLNLQNFDADKKFAIVVSYATIYLYFSADIFFYVYLFHVYFLVWSCAKFNPEMVFIAIVILVDWFEKHKRYPTIDFR